MRRATPPKDRLNRVVNGPPKGKLPPGARPLSGGEPAPLPRRKEPRDGKLEKQIGGIAIGVMIAAGLFYGDRLAMRNVGRAVESKLESHYNNIGTEHTGELIPRRKSDDQEATERLRERCRPSPKIRSANTSLDFQLPHSEARTIAFGEFVECVLKRDRHRLCNVKERQIAAADIVHFSTMRNQHRRLLQELRGEASSGFAVTVLAIQDDLEFAKASVPLVEAARADLAQVVRSVVAQGYLSAKDFGYQGLPTDFAAAFKTDGPVDTPCK